MKGSEKPSQSTNAGRTSGKWSSDSFADALHDSQRIERQRLLRDEEYEIYQARKRRTEPDYGFVKRAIRLKYAFLRRRLIAGYEALRKVLDRDHKYTREHEPVERSRDIT